MTPRVAVLSLLVLSLQGATLESSGATVVSETVVSEPAPASNSASTSASGRLAPEGFPDEPTDARTLLRALATVEGLEARFKESKHLALLRAPLVSEGRLYYVRPGHMARIVDTPTPSTVRIGPHSLELRDSSGTQQVDLRSRPDIKMFVESFVHVVAGHYDQLASTYTLAFTPAPAATNDEGERKPWRLTLTPARKPLSDLVERLEIRGTGYEVATIEVIETHGDTTEITMSAVDPRRRFSDEERERIFGLPPAS